MLCGGNLLTANWLAAQEPAQQHPSVNISFLNKFSLVRHHILQVKTSFPTRIFAFLKQISHFILAFLLLPLALYLQALPARQWPPATHMKVTAALPAHNCCLQMADPKVCCEQPTDHHAPANTSHHHSDGAAGSHHSCPGGHCAMPCCHAVVVDLWAQQWQAAQFGTCCVKNARLCPTWTDHLQKPEAHPPQA